MYLQQIKKIKAQVSATVFRIHSITDIPMEVITVLEKACEVNFCFLMFIFERERKRDIAWAGEGQTEGDTESETGSMLWAVSTDPNAGLEPTNREIMTWAEVGA